MVVAAAAFEYDDCVGIVGSGYVHRHRVVHGQRTEVDGRGLSRQCSHVGKELLCVGVVETTAKGCYGDEAAAVGLTHIDAVAALGVEVHVGYERAARACLVVAESEEQPVHGGIGYRQVDAVPLSALQTLGILSVAGCSLDVNAELRCIVEGIDVGMEHIGSLEVLVAQRAETEGSELLDVDGAAVVGEPEGVAHLLRAAVVGEVHRRKLVSDEYGNLVAERFGSRRCPVDSYQLAGLLNVTLTGSDSMNALGCGSELLVLRVDAESRRVGRVCSHRRTKLVLAFNAELIWLADNHTAGNIQLHAGEVQSFLYGQLLADGHPVDGSCHRGLASHRGCELVAAERAVGAAPHRNHLHRVACIVVALHGERCRLALLQHIPVARYLDTHQVGGGSRLGLAVDLKLVERGAVLRAALHSHYSHIAAAAVVHEQLCPVVALAGAGLAVNHFAVFAVAELYAVLRSESTLPLHAYLIYTCPHPKVHLQPLVVLVSAAPAGVSVAVGGVGLYRYGVLLAAACTRFLQCKVAHDEPFAQVGLAVVDGIDVVEGRRADSLHLHLARRNGENRSVAVDDGYLGIGGVVGDVRFLPVLGVGACRRIVGGNAPVDVAPRTVRVSDVVGDAVGRAGGHSGPSALPALVEDGRSIVGIAPLPVAQHHVAPVAVAQPGIGTAVVLPANVLLQLHQALVVPVGKCFVLAQIVERGRDGHPLYALHEDGVAAKPRPPTHSVAGEI